ncbi:MAG TPA: hypothetical protein DEB17_03510 [Chlorobaculum sp.]|uniref:Uncharacterized protein n=1 Tax=Chlorobaculum tepidum (strain ATCC 49652 / DSM 12025 / NBRC 103806 / TLS) TaxID=194439 RepID=Q8KDR1_CHLTE|nr:TorF family putative porin [Chlorobaculum tepidum]AAM72219.1 hypothetical protein CT0984 [Chlorobaculum tepidum TLS]HBU23052.1 hypothetical protein [Chlorobaculum sp.]
MKKTAKLIALAAVLFAGFGSTSAKADEGFKIGADVVSSYVWRGAEIGDSPAIQPNLSYTFKNGLNVGLWGSYAIEKNTPRINNSDYRYKEVDLTVSMPVGPVTFAVTDYYVPVEGGETNTFDFGKDSANTVEVSGTYTYKNASLMAGVFVGGNDYDNAWYCEANYKFYDKNGYTAKATAGLGNEGYYGDGEGKKLALVNTGISISKDRYTASAIYNPDTEKSYLVFMASF